MQILSIGKKKRIHSIAFSPNGEELAAVSGDLQIRIWNLATGEVRRSAPIVKTSCGYDIAYLDNDRLMFSGSDLQWWDITSDAWHMIAPGHPWDRRIAISPEAGILAEVDQTRSTDWSAGNGLLTRDASDWQLQPTMESHDFTTGGVTFSRDGRFLATGHMRTVGQQSRMYGNFGVHVTNEYDYLVHLRKLPGGRIVKTLDGWQQAVVRLAFSPDSTVLAGTAGPRLRVWDLESNREIALHKRGSKHFQGLSFTHDGRYLATVSNDETVRVWDARTWEEHTTYTWEIGALLNIVFAPDGMRAATGSDKGQIVIWDVE